LNWVLPPIWRSSSFDAVPLAVLVALTKRAASTTPVVFHVGVMESAGRIWEPFSEFATFNGVAVEPTKVETCTSYGTPAAVEAVVSPNTIPTRPDVVVAQFHSCA
jgi:hypothetical protein